MPGNDDLGRGAFVLAAVLALVAWLRPEERRAPPQILVGIGIVVAALVLSSSGAIAKGQFVNWENWDFYNRPGKPVNVEYVWRANYDGGDFPKDRPRVFTVQAPARSLYWRATTLDAFTNDHWDEDLYSLYSEVPSNPVVLTDDPLLPASARDRSKWTRADVTIDALRDAHLVGPSQPVPYNSQEFDAVLRLQQRDQPGVGGELDRVPVLVVVCERDALRRRGDPPLPPVERVLLAHPHCVTALLRGPHHCDARILVRLERLGRRYGLAGGRYGRRTTSTP